MNKKIIIGSRGSKLALIYAQNAKSKIIQNTNINSDDIVIKEITTKGDQVQDQRLSEVGGKGLFSTNIEKDTFLERNDPREVLITKNKKKLKDLKAGAVIGTSSYRREFQIKKIRSDINCKLIRGNVDTRIKKLNDGLYDGILLSYAGIKSLSLEDKITEVFSTQKIVPSAGQGVISLQCRNDDKDVISILEKVNDQITFLRAHAERNILKVLEGDCETAVGAHAVIDGGEIILEAELFSLDGTQRFYEKKSSKVENAKLLGEEVGNILKTKSNNSYKK
jgi:hydroxymethylbilane synthase